MVKKRLEAHVEHSKLPDLEAEDWQITEINAGLKDLGTGDIVSHKKVSKWLRSWDKANETKAPR